MAPRSRMEAIVIVAPRIIVTGKASAAMRSANQIKTPQASQRVCFTSGPPKIASSTGSAARKDGRSSHAIGVRAAARARDPGFLSIGITSSASSLRPKPPPLANESRFRTECARVRLRAPEDNCAPARRAGEVEVARHQERAVLSLLDDDRLRSQGENPARRPVRERFPRQIARLLLVDEQDAHALQ